MRLKEKELHQFLQNKKSKAFALIAFGLLSVYGIFKLFRIKQSPPSEPEVEKSSAPQILKKTIEHTKKEASAPGVSDQSHSVNTKDEIPSPEVVTDDEKIRQVLKFYNVPLVDQLIQSGFDTPEKVINLKTRQLKNIRGFGPKRIEQLKEAQRKLRKRLDNDQ